MDGARGQARVSARFLVVGLIQRRIRMRGGGSRDTIGARCRRVQNTRSGRARCTHVRCSSDCQWHLQGHTRATNQQDGASRYERSDGHAGLAK